VQAFASDVLPKTQTFNYYEPEPSENQVEFRLIYKGSLPAEGQDGHDPSNRRARAPEKQRIRKQLHLQLRELWNQHPELRIWKEAVYEAIPGGIATQIRSVVPGFHTKTWLEHIADSYVACDGNRFVPLIREASGFTCSLDILFLRRDNPGSLIQSGGDIDNRIKVLLDGLKMPRVSAELGGLPIETDEDPWGCPLSRNSLKRE
jgi:hypothetical protein